MLFKNQPVRRRVLDVDEVAFAREGLTDIPIPSLTVAREFITSGYPAWAYFCGGPRGRYAQRLLDNLDTRTHEVHVVLSHYAHAVLTEELPGGLRLPDGAVQHGLKSMNVPFASASKHWRPLSPGESKPSLVRVPR